MRRLLGALEARMFVLSSGRGLGAGDQRKGRRGSWARLETNASWRSVDSCIRAIASIIEGLDDASRADWDGLIRRDLCIGVERGGLDWSPVMEIGRASVERAARLGCSISVVVYPSMTEDDRAADRRAPIKRARARTG